MYAWVFSPRPFASIDMEAILLASKRHRPDICIHSCVTAIWSIPKEERMHTQRYLFQIKIEYFAIDRVQVGTLAMFALLDLS